MAQVPDLRIPRRLLTAGCFRIRVVLAGFDPLVAEWFATRFGAPTEPQVRGWPEIRAGHDVLISAPTGSGKTLAAFLIGYRRPGAARPAWAAAGRNRNRLRLAAQGAQQRRPQESRAAAGRNRRAGGASAALRSRPFAPRCAPAIRRSAERQKMTRQPPHILVTTPESLYILLTAAKPREMLRRVRTADRGRDPRRRRR